MFQFLIGTVLQKRKRRILKNNSSVSIPYRYGITRSNAVTKYPMLDFVSIPYRYGITIVNSKICKAKPKEFQFLIGTVLPDIIQLMVKKCLIKSMFQFLIGTVLRNMLRQELQTQEERDIVFQFLIGTVLRK